MNQTKKSTMKAAVFYNSPDTIKVEELERPVPKKDEVLISIYAASVNAVDWRMTKRNSFSGKIPGADIAGIVEAVGESVSQWKSGDKVYGCLADIGFGGFAEYVCVKESFLAPMPSEITFEEASAAPMAAVVALQGLKNKGQIQPGKKVLINGASGGIGTFAVQIAKAFDTEVTGVCSPNAVETVRSLGADHVIDYTKEDFSKNGIQYDLILEIAANHSVNDYRRALKPNGICVIIGFSNMKHMLKAAFARTKNGKKITPLIANNKTQSDLLYIKNLFESGKLKSVIDQYYPLTKTAEAIRHVESGHPKGKVIIQIKKEDLSL